MYRDYNQSREMLERKPQFDPTFWEICVDPENLCRVPGSNRLHYESEEETRSRQDRLDWVEQTFSKVVTLMDEVLTPRQNQIVRIAPRLPCALVRVTSVTRRSKTSRRRLANSRWTTSSCSKRSNAWKSAAL